MDERWILDDAERALLVILREQGVGPMESATAAGLCDLAEHNLGFPRDRLSLAIDSLSEKLLIEPMGDGRIRLTKNGFLHAHQAV